MSFSFGTPTTNAGLSGATSTPAAGAFSFGAQPTAGAQLPAFGSNTATSNQASAAGAAAAPSFNFAPTAATVAPALSFGTPASSTPVAATGAVPSFGNSTATPTFGGAPAVPAFGSGAGSIAPNFGAGTSTVRPTFGTGVASTAPTFGAATAAPTFGAGAAAAAPAFGAAAATTAPTFGAAVANTFGGAATTPAFLAVATTSTFGAPASGTGTATAGTLAFAASAAAPAFGAAPATAAVAPTFNFPAAKTNAPTTAPPAFGTIAQASGATFSFNKPATTTAATLNFNTTTTTASAQPFNTNLRLGGNTIGSTATGGIFGKPLTTGAAPVFAGLGGIDVSATQPKLGDNNQDVVKIKETQVPDEIVKTVNDLKNYIKEQKTISSEIGRTSTSKLNNVGHEIMNLRWMLQSVANSVDTSNGHIKQLRSETAKAIQSLEMAQRTQDTPAGLQFENNAPFQYFQCLVARYEEDLIAFRQQILLTESHMHALANPQSISPDELKRGFRQLNESFISLAGRLHEVHQRVEEQKEQYLNLRRYRMRDANNVFAAIDNPTTSLVEPQRLSCGPSPFSIIAAMSTLNKTYASAPAATASNAAASK